MYNEEVFSGFIQMGGTILELGIKQLNSGDSDGINFGLLITISFWL